jgi:hypothetical protein
MTGLQKLLDALKSNNIEIESVQDDRVRIKGTYEIEIEPNGMYKLLDDGYIVAPFNDAGKLCRFILAG